MSSFNKQIWEQATLAMAEEYLESVHEDDQIAPEAKAVLGRIIPGAIPNEQLTRITQLRLVTQMEIHLQSELNMLMENER